MQVGRQALANKKDGPLANQEEVWIRGSSWPGLVGGVM